MQQNPVCMYRSSVKIFSLNKHERVVCNLSTCGRSRPPNQSSDKQKLHHFGLAVHELEEHAVTDCDIIRSASYTPIKMALSYR